MNFVAQVEEHLRDLGAEARKKHPGVKEASERAILQLRTLQNAYVTAVRKASGSNNNAKSNEHPTTALFQSQDLLRPFLLAANYPNASPKLLDISLKGMSLLIKNDAICPGDGIHMVRVWTIQANGCAAALTTNTSYSSSKGSGTIKSNSSSTSSWLGSFMSSSSTNNNNTTTSTTSNPTTTTTPDGVVVSSSHPAHSKNKEASEKVALELLRCLILLLDTNSSSTTTNNNTALFQEEQWTASIALCCILGNVQALVVQQAAKTSLHQVLGFLFATSSATKEEDDDDNNTATTNQTFVMETWRDLLILASQEQSPLRGAFSQCKSSAPSTTLCLELMVQIIRSATEWFRLALDEIEIESLQVARALLDDPSTNSFELVWRSYKLAGEILTASDYDVAEEESTLHPTETDVATDEDNIDDDADVEEDSQQKEAEECREELIQSLVEGIVRATELCRNDHEFEDGYIYMGGLESGADAPSSKTYNKASSLIPDSMLWRAGLALETLYTILERAPSTDIVSSIAEAVSDFCTIGASCQDHMMKLVQCSQQARKDQDGKPIMPSLLRKAEQIQSAAAAVSQKLISDTNNIKKNLPSTSCNIGEPLWIAFHCILEISKYVDEEASFAPSLAVLQHYLKRFPASKEITESTLLGYDRLAHVIESENPLQRKALVSSLCKLSLPSWGKHDASTQLQDHHVKALLCLLRIVHKYREGLKEEWHMVLWTFEELSALNIASPRLSDDGYHSALLVSSFYNRIAPLSTVLSVDSLSALMQALVEISGTALTKRIDVAVAADFEIVEDKKSSGKDKGASSIGGNLMSFAGKAILGEKATENGKGTDTPPSPKIKRAKVCYGAEYKQDFHRRLDPTRALRTDSGFTRMPFSLLVMTDIALSNTFRFTESGPVISATFCTLADNAKEARTYAMDTLVLLVTSQLSNEQTIPASFVGPGSLVREEPDDEHCLKVIAAETNGIEKKEMSQVDLLSPLCNAIMSTKEALVAVAGITSLHSLLEGSGHKLTGKVWTVVIDAIASLSGADSYEMDRTGPDWSSSCMLAFRCLKLIVVDFLENLPPPTDDSSIGPRKALMECCTSFGSSRHDVNTSLTAVGLLWTIADQDADSSSIERAFSKLVHLAADRRTEVRNCSVNTLFSCIVGKGNTFTVEQWERCIADIIFGVYDKVLSRGGLSGDSLKSPEKKYKTAVHYSRDSADKQWATTEVLVLQGLSRVLRNNFSDLLSTTVNVKVDVGKSPMKGSKPWFVGAWSRFIEMGLRAAKQGGGRDTLDLRCGGIDLVVLCNQLSCRAGIQAAIVPARVGTNMEVVNGALRSVGDTKNSPKDQQKSNPEFDNMYREELFVAAFDGLCDFRDHFVTAEKDDEVKKSKYMESVQVMVLQRLADGLGKMYECCKDEELLPRRPSNGRDGPTWIERTLSVDSESIDPSDLEARFVYLVGTVAKKAAGNQTQYLTQAQRGSIDLMKDMIENGSDNALKMLTSLGGTSFFWVIDKDSAGNGDDDEPESDALHKESATVVSTGIENDRLSDSTKAQVLCHLLAVFARANDKESWKADSDGNVDFHKKRSYKLFLPVAEAGLAGAERLVQSADGENYLQLLDLLWDRIDTALSRMLAPLQIPSHAPYISQASNLAELIKSAVTHAPRQRHNEICNLLSSGALKSVEVAKDHADDHTMMIKGDGKVRSKKRKDESLKMYRECIGGLCRLQPESEILQSISKQVFKNALASLDDDENNKSVQNIAVEIAIITCKSIRGAAERGMEVLVIASFPQLCLLISTTNDALRNEAASVMETVNISKAIQDATFRMETAEKKAEDALKENELLTIAIEELREENIRLQRDNAVLTASAALS